MCNDCTANAAIGLQLVMLTHFPSKADYWPLCPYCLQDMSIDVYGRADKKARDEAMAKAAAEADAAAKVKADQEESDLDALLAA